MTLDTELYLKNPLVISFICEKCGEMVLDIKEARERHERECLEGNKHLIIRI